MPIRISPYLLPQVLGLVVLNFTFGCSAIEQHIEARNNPKPGPEPIPSDTPEPEAETMGYAMDPPGTRGDSVRCQAAPEGIALRFMPSWYTFTDASNVGTTEDCQAGASKSLVEVLPYDETDIVRCALGWEGEILKGAKHPFAGLGVRLADSDMSDVGELIVETRSTAITTRLRMELVMRQQEMYECGDERKANYGADLRCDGTGTWRRHVLPVSSFAASWGKPPPLDTRDLVALHFLTAPGTEGAFDCDIRIVGLTAPSR